MALFGVRCIPACAVVFFTVLAAGGAISGNEPSTAAVALLAIMVISASAVKNRKQLNFYLLTYLL